MAKKPTAKKATKKTTIKTLVQTVRKGVAKLDDELTYLVLDAFPERKYIRPVKSLMEVDDYENEYCYTFVFEVDEGYYRIVHVVDSGIYAIGPDEGFDQNHDEISLTAKAIREWVENFEREATGEEGADGKKYEFTGETKEVDGHTLHRIRALRKITDPSAVNWEINEGDLGGWIEGERNLSHEGAAWVDCDACVYGNALVHGNALVTDYAKVYGTALVYGDAQVFDTAVVYGDARVFDNAKVYEDAQVYGRAQVHGKAEVCGVAQVCDNADAREDIWDGSGDAAGEPEETTEPETEDTLKHRMAVLEGRVDKLADEMTATVKDIKAIKKKLNM